jgi:MYXO-CTERM domain-containing protein
MINFHRVRGRSWLAIAAALAVLGCGNPERPGVSRQVFAQLVDGGEAGAIDTAVGEDGPEIGDVAAEVADAPAVPDAPALGDAAAEAGDVAPVDVLPGSGTIPVKINFQIATTATPAGYQPDIGLVYGDRGNGYTYGWLEDNQVNHRERMPTVFTDLRYNTLAHLQKTVPDARWEIAVPNGTYYVHVVTTDPPNVDSDFRLNVEGQLAILGVPDVDTFFDNTVVVTVSDGKLTVSNGVDAINDKINFIEIYTTNPTDGPPGNFDVPPPRPDSAPLPPPPPPVDSGNADSRPPDGGGITPPRDAAPRDAATGGSSSGCGCRLGGAASPPASSVLALGSLLAAAMLTRRRRRR